MAKKLSVKKALGSLSSKRHARLAKLLKLKPGTKVTTDHLLGAMGNAKVSSKAMQLLRNGKPAMKIAASKQGPKRDIDDEEDDDELDTDIEDTDEEDDDEEDDESDDAEDDDDAEDSDDADDEESDDEDDDAETEGRQTRRIAASRSDRHTAFLMSSVVRNERENAIRKGGITPVVAEALDRLLLHKGKPNELALSAVPGSNDPLAVKLYKALARNKPVPMKERSRGQEAQALSRRNGGTSEDRELRKLAKETEAWAHRRGTQRTAKTV